MLWPPPGVAETPASSLWPSFQRPAQRHLAVRLPLLKWTAPSCADVAVVAAGPHAACLAAGRELHTMDPNRHQHRRCHSLRLPFLRPRQHRHGRWPTPPPPPRGPGLWVGQVQFEFVASLCRSVASATVPPLSRNQQQPRRGLSPTHRIFLRRTRARYRAEPVAPVELGVMGHRILHLSITHFNITIFCAHTCVPYVCVWSKGWQKLPHPSDCRFKDSFGLACRLCITPPVPASAAAFARRNARGLPGTPPAAAAAAAPR